MWSTLQIRAWRSPILHYFLLWYLTHFDPFSPLTSTSIQFSKVSSSNHHSPGPHQESLQNSSQWVNESVTSRETFAAKNTFETYLCCCHVNLPIQYLKLSLNWVRWIFALLHTLDCFCKLKLDIFQIKPNIARGTMDPDYWVENSKSSGSICKYP